MASNLTCKKAIIRSLAKYSVYFLVFLIAGSCEGIDNLKTDSNNDESGSLSNTSTIKFSLADSASKGEIEGGALQPDTIFIMDILKRGDASDVNSYDFSPDEDGQVNFVVPKDGLYAIGFLGTEGSKSVSRAKGGKDIASGVGLIGNINIVSSGLNMLPVSGNAQDVIDLGPLEQQNGEFSSALTVGQTSTGLGIEEQELLNLGVYDEALRKFYNIDINDDGVIDWEQGLKWDFRCLNYIKDESASPPLDYSYQTLKIVPSEMQIDTITYIIDLAYEGSLAPEISITEYPALKEAKLYALDKTLMIGADAVEYLSGYTFGTAPGVTPGKFQTQFKNINAITSPKVPFGGDFELVHQGIKHQFKNIFFINRDAEYEGFMHPFYRMGVDGEGNILNIEWEFRIARDNVFVPMSKQESSYLLSDKVLVNIGYIDVFGEKKYFDANSSSDAISGQIDLRPWSLTIANLTDIDIYTNDRGKNMYGVVFRKP